MNVNILLEKKLKHIVSKEAFNIEGLGKKVIDQFWDFNLIKEPSDIFKLDYKKIRNFEGWGDLSIDNLKNAIVKSKKYKLRKICLFDWNKTYRPRKCKNTCIFF